MKMDTFIKTRTTPNEIISQNLKSFAANLKKTYKIRKLLKIQLKNYSFYVTN